MTAAEHTAREVILYTRINCTLCDDAASELRALRDTLRFTLTEIDIDADPALREQYDEIVPAVAVGGRVIAQAPIAPGELRDALTRAIG